MGPAHPESTQVGPARPADDLQGTCRCICEVSTRRVQRPGRCSQLPRASCRDRVVSPPSGGESTSSCVGQSVNRPVCDLPQREAARIARLSRIPRPSSRMRFVILGTTWICTRSLPLLWSVGWLPASSSRRVSRWLWSRLSGQRRSGSQTCCFYWPNHPWLCLAGTSCFGNPLQSVPSRRPRAEPSRVATLKRHYRKSGFSGRAARVLSGVLRESSSRLYQSRWKIFCGWCRGRGVAPVNATVPVVVDFLIHLRQDKGLSVSAVKGYCSALNSVLALKGRDLAASREITTLLRSFARSVNPVELRPPAWDISLVLHSLTGAPYEPLRTCEERFLAQKTLFLLALASAKRIESLIPGTGVRFPLLLSRALWPRLRIPLPLLLGLKALQYRPYQTHERIAMGDYCVLCGQSRFTLTALLHIVRDVNGCLSPQGVARRRLRRPQSPSGSGRRYHALTSSLERHCQCLPPELVRRVVSLRQFFSERILLSTRCWRRVRGAGIQPLRVTTWGTLPIGPSTPSTWALWWRHSPWFKPGLPALT